MTLSARIAASLPARILAVLAALCLVGAFALATLLPPTMSLAQLVARMDHTALVAMQNWVSGHISEWTWRHLLLPIFLRPDWMLLLFLGLIFAAAAITVASAKAEPRSRHRRS